MRKKQHIDDVPEWEQPEPLEWDTEPFKWDVPLIEWEPEPLAWDVPLIEWDVPEW